MSSVKYKYRAKANEFNVGVCRFAFNNHFSIILLYVYQFDTQHFSDRFQPEEFINF